MGGLSIMTGEPHPIPNDEQCRICEQAIRKAAIQEIYDHVIKHCDPMTEDYLDELRKQGEP